MNKIAFRKLIRPELNVLIFMVLSILVGVVLSRNFLDAKFLLGSASLYVELAMIALPFTFLMTVGEIDLSIAGALSLVACFVAVMYDSCGVSMEIAIVLGVCLGIGLGLINGLLVVITKLPSLILTIGTMSIYNGLAQVLVGDRGISGFPRWFNSIDQKMVFGLIPLPIVAFLVMAVAFGLIYKFTYAGRVISTIGLNKEVAFYSGINVNKTVCTLFCVQGLFCAIAALMTMSRLQMAKYTIGANGQMDVITMVLLGGTAFVGGNASILGTVLAFFIIVFIRTGMRLALLSNYAQMAILGVLLIVIIIMSQWMEGLSKKYAYKALSL